MGPHPQIPEKVNRSEIQIKISRLLQAKNIEDELTEREKFIYLALQQVWKSNTAVSNKLHSLQLVKHLISEIQDVSEIRKKEKQISLVKKERQKILKRYKFPLSVKDQTALESLLIINDREYQNIFIEE